MATEAPTLRALWQEAHGRWPDQTRFDGIMGDASHQARKSDHNSGNALDVGIIPERGPLGDHIAAVLITDSRTKYVIWNRRIWTRDRGWHAYTGASPHTGHVHISIYDGARNDMRPWLSTAVQEEDDMTDAQAQQLADIHKYLFTGPDGQFPEGGVRHRLNDLWHYLFDGPGTWFPEGGVRHQLNTAIPGKLAEIESRIEQLERR